MRGNKLYEGVVSVLPLCAVSEQAAGTSLDDGT